VIDAAQAPGVEVVCTFAGNDRSRNVPENLKRFRSIWPPLVGYAGDRSVKIAIEACPMISTTTSGRAATISLGRPSTGRGPPV
jgi:sugar phosphate isomerase/epimerase